MIKTFLYEISKLTDRHGIIMDLRGAVIPLRDAETDRIVAHVFFDDYDGQYKERPATSGPRSEE